MRRVCWLGTAVVCFVSMAAAQQPPKTPLALVQEMVAHEDDDSAHRDRYEFVSKERSERTGGHLWTERVVETSQGRVRRLIAVDGQPVSAERDHQERARLQAIVVNPSAFLRSEQTEMGDEKHSRQMLDMLPRAYLFDHVRLENGVWRMDFHPNPAYSPTSLEERVLYGMSGWVAIDEQQQRMIHIEGKLPQDVSIGFGFLATIHAGSQFSSDRRDMGGHWRTVHVLSDIRGRAALFKTLARNSEVTRSEFVYLDSGTSIAQAVELLLQ